MKMISSKKNAILPRRNAPRKCKRPRPGISEGNIKKVKLGAIEENARTYFSTLPQDALENILRFTSQMPYAEKWKAFVAPEIALRVLKSRTELTACALRLYDSIQRHEFALPQRNAINVTENGNAYIEQVEELMSALSAVLTRLDIHGSMGVSVSGRGFPSVLTRSLISHCPNLKHLSLRHWNLKPRYVLDQILGVRSGKLESLELAANMRTFDVNAIAAHCKGLKRLVLHIEYITASLAPVWRTVGASLEELSLGQKYLWRRLDPKFLEFPAIVHYCKSIRKLTFDGLRSLEMQDLVEDLIVGYGRQLKSLTLEQMDLTVGQLASISLVCENVSVNMYAGNALRTLSAIGPSASHISIWIPRTHDDGSEMYELVSRKCVNLVSIDLTVIDNDTPRNVFKAIFAHPKKMLTEFTGAFFSEGLGVLGVLADQVTTLKSMTVTKSWLSFPEFSRLVVANQALSRIQLHVIENSGICRCSGELSPTANWGTIIKTCLECPNLRELDFSCVHSRFCAVGRVSEFAEACHAGRHRGLSVRICKHQYL